VRTRIPVWVLEQSRRMGMSEAEILRAHPRARRTWPTPGLSSGWTSRSSAFRFASTRRL